MSIISDTFRQVLAQLRALFLHKLALIVLGIGAAFLLFGAVGTERVLAAVLLLVGVRVIAIVNEGLRKCYTAADWDARHQALASAYAQMSTDEFEDEMHGLGLTPPSSPQEVARSVVAGEQQVYVEPRRVVELLIEVLGMLALLLLAPATIALYTRDFVSLRSAQDWLGLLTILGCAGVYLWPLTWRVTEEQHRNRTIWWGLPILPLCGWFYSGLTERHPYLDPTAENHLQQAADKVLSLDAFDIILAEHHADWIFDYAVTLARAGNLPAAIDYYQQGLKISPQAQIERDQLTALQAQSAGTSLKSTVKIDDPHRPYWTEGQHVPTLPICALDAGIENVSTTTIVVIRSGNVTPDRANHVGDVLRRVLKVPVCTAESVMLIPEYTRMRGIITGRQWNVTALAESFIAYIDPMPEAPLKFVILTDVDIYSDDANYVFSTSYEWGAVVSSAIFSETSVAPFELNARTAKQALGAIVKTFDIPAADDPSCVTSYTNGLDQFDRKGNFPNAATMALFVQRLDENNARWNSAAAHR